MRGAAARFDLLVPRGAATADAEAVAPGILGLAFIGAHVRSAPLVGCRGYDRKREVDRTRVLVPTDVHLGSFAISGLRERRERIALRTHRRKTRVCNISVLPHQYYLTVAFSLVTSLSIQPSFAVLGLALALSTALTLCTRTGGGVSSDVVVGKCKETRQAVTIAKLLGWTVDTFGTVLIEPPVKKACRSALGNPCRYRKSRGRQGISRVII